MGVPRRVRAGSRKRGFLVGSPLCTRGMACGAGGGCDPREGPRPLPLRGLRCAAIREGLRPPLSGSPGRNCVGVRRPRPALAGKAASGTDLGR